MPNGEDRKCAFPSKARIRVSCSICSSAAFTNFSKFTRRRARWRSASP